MINVPVLFVDDEEDIRFSFEDHFEGQFQILLAGDGVEALDVLGRHRDIGVVVTDIRMPELDGLELIRRASGLYPDIGFIVVSGHGHTEDIITAMGLGARNYLRKPYDFAELEAALLREGRRFSILREESARQEKERIVGQFLTSVEGMTYYLPSRMDLVPPLAFRLVGTLELMGVVEERQRGNVGLAIIEIVNNAIEHGNLGLSLEEKVELKTAGENQYLAELKRRSEIQPYCGRKVKVTFSATAERAELFVEDEGEGFDHLNLPDPTHPDNLFLPSGRGILLARTFLDEVEFIGKGNLVRLLKRRTQAPARSF